MTLLTLDQYFQVNNKALSRSKIQDFFKGKQYFHAKHIEGSIENETKDCYKFGSAADDLLAQIDNKNKYHIFDGDFRSKENRELKAMLEEQGKIVIKQAEYNDIMAVALAVEATDAYQSLKDHTRQMLLQMPWTFANGLFDKVVSLPDFIKITGKHADIADLKTSADFDIKKWYYKCRDYSYFEQFAMSQLILESRGIESFSFKHLIAVKNKNINDVFAVTIPNDLVSVDDLINKITVISNTTNFDKYNPTWERALMLRDPREEFEDL